MTLSSRDGKDPNHRDLLRKMLESQPDIEQQNDEFRPKETISLELLMKAGGGSPAPLSRIEALTLHDDFISIRALEATTLLPYSVVVGLRVIQREKSRGPGFTR